MTMEPYAPSFIKTMQALNIPGAAMALVSDKKIHEIVSYGVKTMGGHDPITPETVFPIASLSKSITACLVGILKEKGVLDFRDPVTRFLPNFFLPSAKIHHLLSHSTGMSAEGIDELIQEGGGREKILNHIYATTPMADVGEYYSYHNGVYSLLGDICEQATGQSFDKLAQNLLFTPLSMTKASVGTKALLAQDNRAFPHFLDEKGQYYSQDTYCDAYDSFQAAVGMNACLQDLIHFLQLCLGGHENVLTRQTLSDLFTPRITDTNARQWLEDDKIQQPTYGLGWLRMVYEFHDVIYHGGWIDGFRSFIAILPQENIAIALLMNSDENIPAKVALDFIKNYPKCQ